MRIYFDVCCLNRSFDDQTQARIEVETEAISLIQNSVEEGALQWCSSAVIISEINAGPARENRSALLQRIEEASLFLNFDDDSLALADHYIKAGVGTGDAFHLAIAETGNCEFFFTVDDRLIAKWRIIGKRSKMQVVNPALWVWESLP